MRARTFIALLLTAAAGCGEPPGAGQGTGGAPDPPAAAAEEDRTSRTRQPVAARASRPPASRPPREQPPVPRPTGADVAVLLDDLLGADPDARTAAAARLRAHAGGVEAFAWLLENGTRETQLLAAQSLRRMGEAARVALPSLLRAARAGDAEVRAEVIGALGGLSDDRALPLLLDLTDDPDATIVRAVVDAIGNYGVRAEPALDRLVELLGEEERWVGDSAAAAIGGIGPNAKSAVPALVEQFDADEGAGTDALLKALAAIGPDAEQAIPAIAREIVRHERNKEEVARDNPTMHVSWVPISFYAEEALVAIGEPAIPQLIELLGHEMSAVRRSAASALEDLGAATRPALLAALADADANRRKHAVEVLVKTGPDDSTVFETVVPLLSDPDEGVRIQVAHELHRFGDAAVPHLIRALTDTTMSWAAAQALQRLGPRAAPAVPALERALEGESSPLRRHAAKALGRIGPAAAGTAPALGRALDDEAEDVRAAAATALRRIGPAAVPALIEAMRGSDRARSAAATALAGMQGESADVTDALLAALDTPAVDVRWRVAVALSRSQQHPERVLPALRAGLQFSEEESELRVGERLAAVAAAIGRYEGAGATALPELLATLRRFKEWSFPKGYVPGWVEAEVDVVKTVIRNFAAAETDVLVALLSDDDEYMREMSRDALVALGAPMIPRLAEVARGDAPGPQVTAVEGLASLARHAAAREELRALMGMSGDARRLQAAKAYYGAGGDAAAAVSLALELIGTSADPDLTQAAAAFLGFSVKARAAFAVKEIRAAHAAATHEPTKRYLGYAIEAIENR